MKVEVVYFEITNKCNLNCMTCYNRSGLNKNKTEISKGQLKQSIDILLTLGLNRVLFSGGEPTLHSQFDDILDIINEYPQISFGIVTNGTLTNQKLIDLLNTKDNMIIQISLDGSNEEENSKTRGFGNFTKSIEFINKIQKGKTKPQIKMVISQNNYDDIENFYRLAISIGATPEYAFVNRQGNGAENWDKMQITAQQKLKALKLIDKLNSSLNAAASLPLCTGSCPLANDLNDMSVCIKVDGSINPCQLLYDKYFCLGNIFNFNLESFNEKISYISDLVKQRQTTDYNCHKCILKGNCNKGCMASAFNLTNDPLACDGDCDYRKLQFVGYDLMKFPQA